MGLDTGVRLTGCLRVVAARYEKTSCRFRSTPDGCGLAHSCAWTSCRGCGILFGGFVGVGGSTRPVVAAWIVRGLPAPPRLPCRHPARQRTARKHTQGHAVRFLLKVKLRYSSPEQAISELGGVTCHMGSHLPPDTSELAPL